MNSDRVLIVAFIELCYRTALSFAAGCEQLLGKRMKSAERLEREELKQAAIAPR